MADEIPYRIERSRNKYSRASFRNGEIVIRLAKNLPPEEEKNHVQDLLKRLTKKILIERKKPMIDPFRPLLDGADEMTLQMTDGPAVQISLQPAKRSRIKIDGDSIIVSVPPDMRQTALHRLLWRAIVKYAGDRIVARVHVVNDATLQVPIDEIDVRIATRQWGSCSVKGRIMLNAALLFVPVKILDYIIIHELAHRIETNHSEAFWEIVEAALPNFWELKEAVNGYRLPTL